MNLKVAVIGAGPIGMATALFLARAGHKVHLFEKGSLPRDKTCGQGIMPSGVRILSKLGVKFENEECSPLKGIRYHDVGLEVCGDLKVGGLGVERLTLSQKLLSLVQSNSNISLYANYRLIHIENLQRKVRCDFIKNDLKESDTFDYAFACDGLNSVCRKLLKNNKLRKTDHRMGARLHFNCPPPSPYVEVFWFNGGEAYITPVSSTKIEVAFLWYKEAEFFKNFLKAKGKSLEGLLLDQLKEIKEAPTLKNPCSDFRSYGPFKDISHKVNVGQVFFVGDAFQFLDGITGEGISLGLNASKLITRNFQRWNSYHSLRLKLLYWHYSLFVNLALSLARFPELRYKIFKIIKNRPLLFNFFLRLNDFHF